MARTGFVSVLQCVAVCCEDGCMACDGFLRLLQCVAVCWEDACMVRSGECVAVCCSVFGGCVHGMRVFLRRMIVMGPDFTSIISHTACLHVCSSYAFICIYTYTHIYVYTHIYIYTL